MEKANASFANVQTAKNYRLLQTNGAIFTSQHDHKNLNINILNISK